MGLLDREATDEYQVTIECEDAGDPSLKTSRELSIRVLDYNDNAPQFGQNVYTQVFTTCIKSRQQSLNNSN